MKLFYLLWLGGLFCWFGFVVYRTFPKEEKSSLIKYLAYFIWGLIVTAGLALVMITLDAGTAMHIKLL